MERSSSDGTPLSRQVVTIPATVSNVDFLTRYARPGCVGLACGTSFIDRAIARAERHIDPEKNWGQWTHAFMFSERRTDGHLWIVESDLQVSRKHIELGVQENRSSKYHDAAIYNSLAVLDFGLSEELTQRVVAEGLDLVANRIRYSLRELIGTLLALKRPELRERSNVLAREQCFYCSAFVQYLFVRAGLSLTCGLEVKNTTPEDIARSPRPHTAYVLQRELLRSHVRAAAQRIKRRVSAQWRTAQRSRR